MAEAPAGFVDIHSHILWELDDGARSMEISLEMCRVAAEANTSDIVATPHSDLQFSFHPEIIESRIAALREATGGRPRIHRGCDFHLHFDNIQDCLANPTKYTINHLRYLMVEFPDSHIADVSSQVFDRMLQRDITPVITHPERNPLLVKQPELVTRWVNAGCLVQVTAHSFLGRFGKRAKASADDLMARGLVHFVASDAHDPVDRSPDLLPAWDYVCEAYGEATAIKLMITNPKAVLTGDYLDVGWPDAEPPKKKWYQLW